jgi:hypothetical protein
MKKLVLAAAAATVLCTTSGLAADLKPVLKAPPAVEATPSPWDWAFGGALMSDYNFRGISQSNRGPSVTAYSETRYNVNSNWQLYAGSQYWAVTLPTDLRVRSLRWYPPDLRSGRLRLRLHLLLVPEGEAACDRRDSAGAFPRLSQWKQHASRHRLLGSLCKGDLGSHQG